jgi:hypothetical protein
LEPRKRVGWGRGTEPKIKITVFIKLTRIKFLVEEEGFALGVVRDGDKSGKRNLGA